MHLSSLDGHHLTISQLSSDDNHEKWLKAIQEGYDAPDHHRFLSTLKYFPGHNIDDNYIVQIDNEIIAGVSIARRLMILRDLSIPFVCIGQGFCKKKYRKSKIYSSLFRQVMSDVGKQDIAFVLGYATPKLLPMYQYFGATLLPRELRVLDIRKIYVLDDNLQSEEGTIEVQECDLLEAAPIIRQLYQDCEIRFQGSLDRDESYWKNFSSWQRHRFVKAIRVDISGAPAAICIINIYQGSLWIQECQHIVNDISWVPSLISMITNLAKEFSCLYIKTTLSSYHVISRFLEQLKSEIQIHDNIGIVIPNFQKFLGFMTRSFYNGKQVPVDTEINIVDFGKFSIKCESLLKSNVIELDNVDDNRSCMSKLSYEEFVISCFGFNGIKASSEMHLSNEWASYLSPMIFQYLDTERF